ncbi:O-succinylbenzoic acid--CoA ligase [Lipingzhangella halophila]|uniref:O-succinylbenzoic acid--CoA ligase n=1 Tax=Lipingzhangella halophila TaxID=1783352 RepID=A0A7W7RHG3_9ACTN|nr:AMP-binding protein [Lipingzhangella halophila]MBB4932058.1 O-succinylbenzoic acid--CoA ligase [Lipingzhangella halophila]
MPNRPLQAVTGLEPSHFTALLAEALDGRGPALLPIGADLPPQRVREVLRATRPGSLRTPDGVRTLDDGAGTADDTALVVATSGSAGLPKGVELSAEALLASARASVRRLGAGRGDDWLCVLPTAHIAGIQVVLRALVNGREPVFAGFDADKVTAAASGLRPHVSLVPTQLRRMLAGGAELSSFASILLGGAAAEDDLLAAARDAGARVVTTYGMSETCGGCVYDGVPLDGMRADVDPDGRVLLAGPALLSGYRLDPQRTSEHLVRGTDGRTWFRTNDLGRFAGDRLRVRGRVDDVINTGGHKVVAAEVASVLTRFGPVAEAIAVGRPDSDWGQRVTAIVVPRDPDTPPTLDELRSWVADHLPRYAAPRELELRSEIPLLATGKPDIEALRSPLPASD